MKDSDPTGGGATGALTGKTGAPQCSAKYSPGSGGYNGAAIEGEGEAGDKGVSTESEYSAATEEGNYNHGAVLKQGDYPHGQADPENLEGPPLASTSNGPNNSNY